MTASGVFRHDGRNHIAEQITGDGQRITYRYDSMDLLVEIQWSNQPDASWTAEYDSLCRRVSKTMGNAKTVYYWDGDRLAAQIEPHGEVRIYVYANESGWLMDKMGGEQQGFPSNSNSRQKVHTPMCSNPSMIVVARSPKHPMPFWGNRAIRAKSGVAAC